MFACETGPELSMRSTLTASQWERSSSGGVSDHQRWRDDSDQCEIGAKWAHAVWPGSLTATLCSVTVPDARAMTLDCHEQMFLQ